VITLNVEPRVVKTWSQFIQEKPPFSLALDGYVRAAPRFNPRGPHANFDHHEEVNRLCTRSSCAQIYLAIQQGLFEIFRKNNEPHVHIYVNDPDQDVCMSVWLLRHADIVRAGNDRIERLMHAVDHLDATAGGYPIPIDSVIMGEIAWIFEPYTKARFSGKLAGMNAAEMCAIIDAVGERMTLYSQGAAHSSERGTEYEVIGGGPGWLLVHELGPYARNKLFAEGMNAFVAARECLDGTYAYSIGRRATWVPFPMAALYEALNVAEGVLPGEPAAWAGSDTIGGSPRCGSKLTPNEVSTIVNGVIADHAPFLDNGFSESRDAAKAA
jgi:hypothetical protein